VALGANLGDPVQALNQAIDALALRPGIQLIARSSLYRTAPIDANGPDYVNAVLALTTTLTAPALLGQLQALEQLAGRERSYRNAPRTLDLDLLLYGAAALQSATLLVPHPRMYERAFVLLPLFEIAPHAVTQAQLQAVQSQALVRLPC
jgi:2-amino-4-hydroxy-6-hydroxymethyldihydropteridine diphosphokinase